MVGMIAPWEAPIPTRAVSRFVRLPDFRTSSRQFFEALVSVIETFSIDLIIPINDRALLAVMPHDAEIRKYATLACAGPDQLATILDKDATSALAQKLGLTAPVSYAVSSWENIEESLARVRFPLIAKVRDKSNGVRAVGAADSDFYILKDAASARELINRVPDFDRHFHLQEFCPGNDVGVAVLMHRGKPITQFQYRAQKTYPIDGGVCVLGRCEHVDPVLAEASFKILRSLSWEGIAQLDFRHDRETGRYVLLEINGRFWGSTAAATTAGADFPYQVWQIAHDVTPVKSPSYVHGRRFRWLEGDIRRLVEAWRTRRRINRIPLWREILRFLTDTNPTTRSMFWSWSDPLPSFYTLWNLGRHWFLAKKQAPAVLETRKLTSVN